MKSQDPNQNDPRKPDYWPEARNSIINLCGEYSPYHRGIVIREELFKSIVRELIARDEYSREQLAVMLRERDDFRASAETWRESCESVELDIRNLRHYAEGREGHVSINSAAIPIRDALISLHDQLAVTRVQRNAAQACIDKLNDDILALKKQLADLKRWKEEQHFVESEWRPQEIAEMLGIPLGASIRAELKPRIQSLKDELAEKTNGYETLDMVALKLVEERDAAQDFADNLANAIADHLGVEIGEHSSCNDPWVNALQAIAAHGKANPYADPGKDAEDARVEELLKLTYASVGKVGCVASAGFPYRHIDRDGYGAPWIGEYHGYIYVVGVHEDRGYCYEIQHSDDGTHIRTMAQSFGYPSPQDAAMAAQYAIRDIENAQVEARDK